MTELEINLSHSLVIILNSQETNYLSTHSHISSASLYIID